MSDEKKAGYFVGGDYGNTLKWKARAEYLAKLAGTVATAYCGAHYPTEDTPMSVMEKFITLLPFENNDHICSEDAMALAMEAVPDEYEMVEVFVPESSWVEAISTLKGALDKVHKIAHMKSATQHQIEQLVDDVYHTALPDAYNPHAHDMRGQVPDILQEYTDTSSALYNAVLKFDPGWCEGFDAWGEGTTDQVAQRVLDELAAVVAELKNEREMRQKEKDAGVAREAALYENMLKERVQAAQFRVELSEAEQLLRQAIHQVEVESLKVHLGQATTEELLREIVDRASSTKAVE